MMKKLLALLCGISIVAVAACDNNSGSLEQVIMKTKVGVVAPLTGEGATYGASMKRGMDLAFKGNANFNIVYEDSKLSSRDGVSAINKLISIDKVSIVYGAASSGVSKAIAPIAAENKVVLLSSISTSDSLTDVTPYFFRNVPKNALQGQTAAQYVSDLGSIKHVAIFNENDEYGINLSGSFKEAIEAFGIDIVYQSSYLNTDTDFRPQLTRIKQSKAEALFIPGNYEETGIILRQAAELDLDVVIIGGDGSYSPAMIKFAGDAAEGFICTVMGINRGTDDYKSFVDLFEAEYNQKPDVYDAYAYEAGLIIKEALEKGGSNVQAYLRASKFNTFSGELSFEGSDMVRPYGISIVQRGEFVDQ